MGAQVVDQIGPDGTVVQDTDARIRPAERVAILGRRRDRVEEMVQALTSEGAEATALIADALDADAKRCACGR